MDYSTIRRLVDGIDSALGPGSPANQVEEIAIEMLSGITGKQAGDVSNEQPIGSISSDRITVHIRVDDCTSRLSSTVVAHGYDKIRRLTSEIPGTVRAFFSAKGGHVPDVELHVHGTDRLIRGFGIAESIDVLSHLVAAGVDATFDHTKVLTLFAGKGGSAADILPAVPDLFSGCPTAGFEIEIGSTAVGIRAQELLVVAESALQTGVLGTAGGRLMLSTNCPPIESIFQSHRDDVKLDLSLSVWPRLADVQSQLPIGACYTDKFHLLGQTGRNLAVEGQTLLASLCASLNSATGTDLAGNVLLSLDAPGEGPQASAVWTGLPVDPTSHSGATRAATILLRDGLRSEIGPTHPVFVTADGHPVSDSIRNFRHISADLSAADLAGYLVGEFADAVTSGANKIVDLLSPPDENESSILGPPGFVEVIDGPEGWNEGHFSVGGALVPPHD